MVRAGGRTYIQYWFYYPDSNSAVLGSDQAWRRAAALLPGRLLAVGRGPIRASTATTGRAIRSGSTADGTTAVRSTSHGDYQWCKQAECRGRWGPRTGWTRVSRGSHAGHIPLERSVAHVPGGGAARQPRAPRSPGVNLRERTTTAEGIELVPLERLDKRGYRRLGRGCHRPGAARVRRARGYRVVSAAKG